ncbi:phosphoenolpyruvate--protein phosphotransferase [Paenibacillus tyrfis]|uniref:phosphoenolpyruvate--protein phosphotransferase n=1 Tax=Paenibacillus tyrfis TaxID=1501230 RepID=UPI0020A076FD|nr:phosphoenolpyruvate--protein phosphotransferase [Paenibacillus tyrfis]MCP1306383.1 phosphoenolpyruvate--protein phosphotransferase [Paenibacillus tyrfis]
MRLQGVAAAPGIAIGVAKVMREEQRPERFPIRAEEMDAELERLAEAIRRADEELQEIGRDLTDRGREHEAEIFEGHRLFLQDEELIGKAQTIIREELIRAEAALDEAMQETVSLLESLDDEYLRERAADIRDVTRRVIRKLLHAVESVDASLTEEPFILIADELTPSQTAQLDPKSTAGFVTASGGKTSHSAILARSLGIPAIIGLGESLFQVQDGQRLVIDGREGVVLVAPTEEQLAAYRQKASEQQALAERYRAFVDRPSVTLDGASVELAANIGSPADAEAAARGGAEGVGLFRTEFLYMGRDSLPTEDEQYEAYAAAARAFGPGAPIVIRTMDIGGDKELPLLELPKEENPFLGYRAIRICLDRPELFKTQLRAILRASAEANVKIMFPMIASLREWRRAKAILEEAKAELRAEGRAFRDDLETGIMIEVPGAALMADRLAKEVDFFSIGTNDLVQYTMAADRMNPKLAQLNDPLQPAVLRLIDQVIRAAAREGKWVGMCGEMAGQPHAVPILLGMGLHEFSMSGVHVARTRALLAKLDRSEMGKLAEAVLELGDPDEVRSEIESQLPWLREYL